MVHLTHPDTGGETLCAADAAVLLEARGWVVSDAIPAHLDPDAPNTGDLPEQVADTAAADAEAPAATDPDDVDDADQDPPTEAAVAEVNEKEDSTDA